jgi:hypothetical protein
MSWSKADPAGVASAASPAGWARGMPRRATGPRRVRHDALGPREGMTVVIGVPKGVIAPTFQHFRW